jgi:hypothetical protein
MEASDDPLRQYPEDIDDPYYRPPAHVLEAAKSQAETQCSRQTTLQQETTDRPAQMVAVKGRKPIFMWPIKDPSNAGLGAVALDDRPLGDRLVNSTRVPHQVFSADVPTPIQWMKSLLAHAHRDILFTADIPSARNYNNLSLKTKSDIDKHIIILRDRYLVKSHILSLISSFVRHVSDILEYFIPEDYDCVVKGKAWAAVHTMLLVGFVSERLA